MVLSLQVSMNSIYKPSEVENQSLVELLTQFRHDKVPLSGFWSVSGLRESDLIIHCG